MFSLLHLKVINMKCCNDIKLANLDMLISLIINLNSLLTYIDVELLLSHTVVQ